MSYIVLARRYRPQTFDELVGQNHVAQALKNALVSNRIAHAYLFSGPRGIGKTSAARILAKALNCKERKNSSPCNACASCEEITRGISMDVIEIDGASNRGIDEIRSLRENVKFAPVGGKYRVYIIDEVHMLTKEAFNALLKTLEEPPVHVIFIFATTEPYKVPLTILSRCQRFDFKKVTVDEIVKHLKYVAGKEGIDVEEEAFYLIAQASEGSIRDSQSLLDQAVSYSGKRITKKDVQDFLGLAEEKILTDFCEIVIKRDSCGALVFLHNLLEKGYDLNQFIKTTLDYLRHILVTIIVSDSDAVVLAGLSPGQMKNIIKYRDAFTKDRLLEVMKILNEAELDIRRSSYPKILMEMALVRMMQKVEGRGEAAPRPDVGAGSKPAQDVGAAPCGRPGERAGTGTCPYGSNAEPRITPRWAEIVRLVKEKRAALGSFLEHCEIVEEKDGEISLGFSPDSRFCKEQVEENSNLRFVSSIVKELTGIDAQIKCVIKDGVRKTVLPEKTVLSDPILKSAFDIFGGEIIEMKSSKQKFR